MKSFIIFLILFFSLSFRESYSGGLENIDNWDNKKYWIKSAKSTHDFFCGMMKISANQSSKYQAKSKDTYKEQCTDIDSYIISNLSYFLAKSKINACENFFFYDDHYKQIKRISKNRREEIFQDCRSLYSKYFDNQKLKNHFGYYFKAFYFDGFSKKEIDYNLDINSYASKKCKQKYYDVGKSEEYEKCMIYKFRELDIYKNLK